MTYDEVLALIAGSHGSDWIDSDGMYVFKPDVSISLRRRGEFQDRETFHEEWATGFPDRTAYREIYELWRHGTLIKTYHFAAVDGGRAVLPYPRAHDDLKITREQFAVACAINPPDKYFIEYIRRFEVE